MVRFILLMKIICNRLLLSFRSLTLPSYREERGGGDESSAFSLWQLSISTVRNVSSFKNVYNHNTNHLFRTICQYVYVHTYMVNITSHCITIISIIIKQYLEQFYVMLCNVMHAKS